MAVCKACNHRLPEHYEIKLFGAQPRVCQCCGQHQDDPTYHGEIYLRDEDPPEDPETFPDDDDWEIEDERRRSRE